MVDKTSPTRVAHEALAALGTCDKVGILRRRIISRVGKASAVVGVCCWMAGGDEEAEIRGVGTTVASYWDRRRMGGNGGWGTRRVMCNG